MPDGTRTIIRELGSLRLVRHIDFGSPEGGRGVEYSIQRKWGGQWLDPGIDWRMPAYQALPLAEGVLDDLGDTTVEGEEEGPPYPPATVTIAPAGEQPPPFPGLDLPADFGALATKKVKDEGAFYRKMLAINLAILAEQVKEDVTGAGIEGGVSDAIDLVEEVERQLGQRDAAQAIADGKKFLGRDDFDLAVTNTLAGYGPIDSYRKLEFDEILNHLRRYLFP